MNRRRLATLRAAVATFVPPDARVERVTARAAEAFDALTPRRRAEIEQLLDLLALPLAVPAARAAVLRGLARSPAVKLRSGYAALKRIALFLAYAEHDEGEANPTWSRIGYPGPRTERSADVPLALAQARTGERIAADAVVIGSGAGGGVAAAILARSGRRVIVLEAGPAFDATSFPQSELALAQMYLEAGLAASDDLGVAIFAGATLGGGTTVNWCTSFELDAEVAEEWSAHSGLDVGALLAPHYAALRDELALAPAAAHNRNNAVIVRGAAHLGVHAAAMPRNAPPDCDAGCGWCGFGCAGARKRSTPRFALPAVVARGGAIYAGARAESITIAGGAARGVQAVQTAADGSTHAFTVDAPLVVCSAGTLRTPGLLARSGVAHPQLGARLYLHPVGGLRAVMDDRVEAWSGPMQSAYSDAWAQRRGPYGVKIETAPTHPGLAALSTPWTSAATHAAAMDGVRNVATLIGVTRDRDPGSISLDGEATVRYRLSAFDGDNLLAGIEGMAALAFAAGAREISTLHEVPIVVRREDWNAAARDRFAAAVRARGIAPNRQPVFSAHQMGTAPLGVDPATSVCDGEGAVRGVAGLRVADGSLFPLASGVNPMLTIMALARHVATAAAAR